MIGFTVGRASIEPIIEVRRGNDVGPDWSHNTAYNNSLDVAALLNKERPKPENLRVCIDGKGYYHLWYRQDHAQFQYSQELRPLSDPPTVISDPGAIFAGVTDANGAQVYVFCLVSRNCG